MDIFDYPKREAQIKKHCFTKLLDFTDYYRFLTLSPLLYQQKKESFRRKTLFSGATRNRTKDTRPEIFNSQSFALSTKKESFRRKTFS